MFAQQSSTRIGEKLERDKYFVKKGFCLLTSSYPASRELNKINVFLKRLCTSDLMYDRLESYVAKLLFQVPLPSRQHAVTAYLHLPKLELGLATADLEVVKISLPGRAELPPVSDEAIKCLFGHLSI